MDSVVVCVVFCVWGWPTAITVEAAVIVNVAMSVRKIFFILEVFFTNLHTF